MYSDANAAFNAAIPSALDLIGTSAWAAAVPDLAPTAERWLRTLPAERGRLAERARAQATPALHPRGIGRVLGVAVRTAGAAGAMATVDAARAAYRTVVMGERRDWKMHAATRRAQALVRGSGPAFVKLGQLIATSRGLLPNEVVDAFSWCRDEVPPAPLHTAVAVVQEELGRPLHHVFSHFEAEPLAAASIAQVHAATLLDGTDVVVKIQRPGLWRRFDADVRAMALLAAFLERNSAVAQAANASGFVELFAGLVAEELDFRLEALNMVEIGLAAERAEMEFVRIPRPYPSLVTRRVLVMERLHGVKYSDGESIIASGADTKALLRLAITGVLEHTVVDGVFHGDLHAGNVLVDIRDAERAAFGLVDFGIVGRLEIHQRVALIRFLMGFATDDDRMMLESMAAFGAVPADADIEFLLSEFTGVRERNLHTGPLTFDKAAEALGDLIRILVAHGFRLPKELVLFFKNLLYLSGFAASLAPDVDLMGEVVPVFEHFQSRYADEMAVIGGSRPGS